MSVDHRAVFGFGVLLNEAECRALLDKLGVEYTHDEPWEELAAKYELQCQPVGCYYRPDVWYLIGPKYKSHVEFGGPNSVAQMTADMDGCYALKEMLSETELE